MITVYLFFTAEFDDADTESDFKPMVTEMVTNLDVEMNVHNESTEPVERLRFHPRTGSLVKLSCNARAAERLRPLDEFNNGVVMTHRPLQDDQLFEVRICIVSIFYGCC